MALSGLESEPDLLCTDVYGVVSINNPVWSFLRVLGILFQYYFNFYFVMPLPSFLRGFLFYATPHPFRLSHMDSLLLGLCSFGIPLMALFRFLGSQFRSWSYMTKMLSYPGCCLLDVSPVFWFLSCLGLVLIGVSRSVCMWTLMFVSYILVFAITSNGNLCGLFIITSSHHTTTW